METIGELREYLKELGFSFGRQMRWMESNSVDWYAYRTLKNACDCTCNDKMPSLIVNPYMSEILHGKKLMLVEVEIFGQTKHDIWLHYKCYSIPFDELKEKLPIIEKTLTASWNAANNEQI